VRAYVLAPLAKADIFDIWAYIAENSESAANRVEQAIYDACAFLAGGPLRGLISRRARSDSGR
jgi:plasmid stabilization system protein ParE